MSPKNGSLKLTDIKNKANKTFQSQKPLCILALKLLLVETPSVMVIKNEKNKTIANENLYTAIGPVNVGQFGPPRSSSSQNGVDEEYAGLAISNELFLIRFIKGVDDVRK
jgi:hypothetical protein